MSIGDNIKLRRTMLGLTLEELAKEVDTSRQTIQRYESGVICNIPSDKIEKIAKVLKCSPSYLMGWIDEKNNKIDVKNEKEDSDLVLIERARNKMSKKNQEKMMNILKATFDEFNELGDDLDDDL